MCVWGFHLCLTCVLWFQDQDSLLQELHSVRYFDVFEFNASEKQWACFVCNHPEKVCACVCVCVYACT